MTSSLLAIRFLVLVWGESVVCLVHVAMVFLDKAFLADPALKSSQLQMAPYMVFHIAQLL